jgi:hypothetical protein
VSATIGRDHVVDLVVGNRCPYTVHFNFVVVANHATLSRPTIHQVAARTSAIISFEFRVEALMPFIVAHPVVSFLRRRAYTKNHRDRTAKKGDVILLGMFIRSPRRRLLKMQGYVEANRLGGVEVDDKLELVRRLHRQVCGAAALEKAIHIGRGAAVLVVEIDPVGCKSPSVTSLPRLSPSYPQLAQTRHN